MPVSFCSLITTGSQLIEPDTYTALRFGGESTDVEQWHTVVDTTKRESALITPNRTAVGLVSALVFWEAPPAGPLLAPTQYLHRITRDPFTAPDSTCTNDRGPTPGAQFHTFSWPMTVRAGQPLCIMVAHNGDVPLNVTLAEFKVWVPS